MGLLDASILAGQNRGNAIGALQQGIQTGQGMIQFGQQQDDRKRQQAFMQALDEEVKTAGDFTTPEGQKKIIEGLERRGFGQEADAIAEKLKPPAGPEWSALPGTGTLFDKKSGETKDTGKTPYQKPLAPPDPLAQAKLDETKRMNDAKIAAMNRPKPDKMGGMGDAMSKRSLLSDWGKSRFDYEKVAQPYLALKAIKNSPSYGTGVGDQSMIDKIIMIETKKVPTEAQYFQFAKNLGIEDKIDRITGKLKSGAILGQEARNNIEAQADEQMKIAHSAYDTDYGQAADMARNNDVDPGKVLRKGGYYDEAGKMLSAASSAKPGGVAAEPKNKAEFDALPPGSLWKDSKGGKHVKK